MKQEDDGPLWDVSGSLKKMGRRVRRGNADDAVPSSRTADAIARAAAARLATLHDDDAFREDYPRYVRRLESNLGPGVDRDDFWEDIRGAAGGELSDRDGLPWKFCAAHSSSALAVNTFGPFRRSPARLVLLGQSGFTETRFEKQLPTGLRGTPPHLDFLAYGPDAIIAVEGKFTEVLAPKAATFAASFEKAVASLADSGWAELYRSLVADPHRFRFVDAAQLVKHYLGVRNSLSEQPQPKSLLYVFWEPANWTEVPEFARHRSEVLAFSVAVSGSDVRFVTMSYPELWESLEADVDLPGLPEQLEYLRRRYVFEI